MTLETIIKNINACSIYTDQEKKRLEELVRERHAADVRLANARQESHAAMMKLHTELFVMGSCDMYADVKSWSEKFGRPTPETPVNLRETPTSLLELRHKLIDEESTEVLTALFNRDMVGVADGLADLIFVALGTAVELGIDLRPVWDEVVRANNAKVGGPTREDGKILKPDGWLPPDIQGVLDRQRS